MGAPSERGSQAVVELGIGLQNWTVDERLGYHRSDLCTDQHQLTYLDRVGAAARRLAGGEEDHARRRQHGPAGHAFGRLRRPLGASVKPLRYLPCDPP